MLSKNASKLVLFKEKKLRKILIIFDMKIDFESQILALIDSLPLLQFSKFGNFIRLQLIFIQKPF